MGHLPKNLGLDIQTKRVMRWYSRICELDRGERHGTSHEMDADEFLVFFIFCYHLKDWVIKETNIPKREIENFINRTQSLNICADIANGTKHFGLTRDPRSGEDFRLRAYATVNGDKVGVGLLITLEDETQIKAIDLAKDCIKNWDAFLSSKF
jgi:hypothetical protein